MQHCWGGRDLIIQQQQQQQQWRRDSHRHIYLHITAQRTFIPLLSSRTKLPYAAVMCRNSCQNSSLVKGGGCDVDCKTQEQKWGGTCLTSVLTPLRMLNQSKYWEAAQRDICSSSTAFPEVKSHTHTLKRKHQTLRTHNLPDLQAISTSFSKSVWGQETINNVFNVHSLTIFHHKSGKVTNININIFVPWVEHDRSGKILLSPHWRPLGGPPHGTWLLPEPKGQSVMLMRVDTSVHEYQRLKGQRP